MAQDIFGHMPMAFGDAMSADMASIMFAGANGWAEAGILTTNMMLNYTQPIMRIYDFGPTGNIGGFQFSFPSQYFIIGRPQGQGNFGKIIGPRALNYCFLIAFGNACGIRNNNFAVSCGTGCDSTQENFFFWVNNCVLQSFGFQVAAQDMMFSANLPFMFISLTVPANAAACLGIAAITGGISTGLLGLGQPTNNQNTSNRTPPVDRGDFAPPVPGGFVPTA